MPYSIDEYLSLKGAVELICEIDPYGSRFDDLVAELPISRPTVSNRLAEGREASILEVEAISGEQGTTHKHVLTEKGALVRLELEKNGTVVAWESYKQARRQFLQRTTASKSEIAENKDTFDEIPLSETSYRQQLRESYSDGR